MSNRFLVIVIVLLALFGGGVALAKHKSNTSSGSSSSNAQPTNHVEGKGTSGVTLIEYGDYQCPACGAYYPIVKQVFAKYQNDIHFQFRNFPLTSIHQNAMAGARAAEAAALQNKFWEMNDLLYTQNDEYYNSNQTAATWINSSNPITYFDQFAQKLGLNVNQFNSDFASTKVNDTINADLGVATKSGFNSTPTFVLDGKKIDKNPQSLDAFNKLIDAEIVAKHPDPRPTQ